tara:strand:+ start:24 stop:797 length:774 start_codon:yes stop_codon:yes gene_type:complete
MGTTRFSGPMMYSGEGRTVASGTWFKNLPLQLNPDYVVQFEDFTGIAVDGTNDWTYSQLTSGTGAILADAVGGWYEIAGTGSDNTGASLQGNEIWQAEASKKLYFETRIVSTDADQMDIFVGLCENGSLATGVPFGTNNQIGFLVTDGDGSISAVCDSGGTETSTDTGVDLADGSVSGGTISGDRRLGFVVTGTGKVEFYVDRVLKVTTTDNIPTSQLATWVAAVAGEAVANKVDCDYLFTAAQRQTDGMVQYSDQV